MRGGKSRNEKNFYKFWYWRWSLRNFLRGHSRNPNSNIEFVGMSVKQPWNSMWKQIAEHELKVVMEWFL